MIYRTINIITQQYTHCRQDTGLSASRSHGHGPHIPAAHKCRTRRKGLAHRRRGQPGRARWDPGSLGGASRQQRRSQVVSVLTKHGRVSSSDRQIGFPSAAAPRVSTVLPEKGPKLAAESNHDCHSPDPVSLVPNLMPRST